MNDIISRTSYLNNVPAMLLTSGYVTSIGGADMDTISRYGVVYKITNTVTGKSYIGKTIDFVSRMSAHRTGHDAGTYFYFAVKKYGWESFVVEKLFQGSCTSAELNEIEIRAIAEHNTKRPNGYNLTDGGEGAPGYVPTAEHRRKIGDAHKGMKRSRESVLRSALKRLGQKRSDESRRLMSEAHKGKTIPPEQRIKIGNSLKGLRLGIKPSEETRRKQSEAHKGKKLSEEQKRKMSEAHKGKSNTKGMKLRPRTEEEKQRIREIVTAWWAKRKAEK